ncbi:Carboxylesterase 1 [Halomicronema hongdechloris C2206]|uniref:Carboxylesterase 1 n=1 Tax=Halomicronema hongdechloris C2206 TaxID=1641165 RepID=A0A1Z3HKN6_9CYAN|nr:esterase [Halomicronema hongdechloris]ASC70871.1 Carboxylesterase 1 [Halomicronema hongdechloris C2206]
MEMIPLTLTALSLPIASPQPDDWLVVALHGWGANASDLVGLTSYITLPGVRFSFPEAPFAHPYAPGGRMWYDLPAQFNADAPPALHQQSDLQESRQRLSQWLRSLPEDSGIPLTRTVLAGFSQGGAMALDVGLSLPLAGLIILSGYCHGPLPATVTPRPIVMVHGTFDPVVPLALAQQARATLQAAGLSVQYHELPMGHEISPQALTLIRTALTHLSGKPQDSERRS